MNSIELAKKIRQHAIVMTHRSHASHIGAILSVTDIVAVLYNDILNITPDNIHDKNRDRCILSKGHAGVSIYAALAEKGFFERKMLDNYYQNGSTLSGHVSHKNKGVEVSTGSLGHGLGIGCGMAYAGKLDNLTYNTYVILGDGECEEGSIWEAVLFASQYKLNNLIAIVDCNKQQAMGFCKDISKIYPIKQKWEAFGWNVQEIDGNNHEELKHALNNLNREKPNCILANTIKGKGVSFMENQLLWHYRDPQGEFYEKAMKELE
jgi:transketolase|uniref:transketolase n=1 Tax=Megamonas funiformis TaxID=437897 RepID=UPI002674FFC5|nr:transketolase [Megamonas funiformis]